MLGWHISVYRQIDGGVLAPTMETVEGPRIAVWQTGLGGLKWLDDLVAAGKAIDLGGNGYPCRYAGRAADILAPVLAGPPFAKPVWSSGAGDILMDTWAGMTVIDQAVADACHADEWLVIEAWDES